MNHGTLAAVFEGCILHRPHPHRSHGRPRSRPGSPACPQVRITVVDHTSTPARADYHHLMTRVLLAEDDASISEPLARALRREGYEVEVREDGPTALDAGLQGGVDLVVLDLGPARHGRPGGGPPAARRGPRRPDPHPDRARRRGGHRRRPRRRRRRLRHQALPARRTARPRPGPAPARRGRARAAARHARRADRRRVAPRLDGRRGTPAHRQGVRPAAGPGARRRAGSSPATS